MNIEQGILNVDLFFTSTFKIPCSIFDILFTLIVTPLLKQLLIQKIRCKLPGFQPAAFDGSTSK